MNCYQEPCPGGKNNCSCGGEPGYRPWEHRGGGYMGGAMPPVRPAMAPRSMLISPSMPAGNADGNGMSPQSHITGECPAGQMMAENSRPVNMSRFPIAMGYVPVQKWQQTYSLEEGFVRGTIFPELDLPFEMGRCI